MKKHTIMFGEGFRVIYGLSFGRAKRILRNKGFKPFNKLGDFPPSSWDFENPDGQYARLFWDARRKSYTIHHK